MWEYFKGNIALVPIFLHVLGGFKCIQKIIYFKNQCCKKLVAGFFLFVQKYFKWRLKIMWRKLKAT
jgi:hypothetical protein